jgi:phosphatidylinositol phosphate synthase
MREGVQFMLDGRWRLGLDRGLSPAGRRLRRVGLTANRLTLIGLMVSALAGWLIARGHFGWATVAIVGAGLVDMLDGAVAKASGTAGPAGAFADSVTDRFSDGLLFGGAAWYFAGVEPRLAVLALAALALSMIVSYERARAEGLGFDGRGGIMERAERLVVLGAGLTFGVLEAALWVIVSLSGVTAAQRFGRVWRQANGVPAHEHVGRPRFADRPRVQRLTQWWPARRAGLGAERGARRWRRARTRP